MPNYCETDLFIHGESQDLLKFLNGLKRDEEGKFSILESYYPMPEDIRNTESPTRIVTAEEKAKELAANKDKDDFFHIHPITAEEANQLMEKYGCTNWYDWSKKYWGSKWGDFECVIKEGEEEEPYQIFISFQSAWCLPQKGLEQVIKQFPTLKFSLYSYEHGMAWQTGLEYDKGELVEQWEHKYHGNRGG
jgi:hypothetical protein